MNPTLLSLVGIFGGIALGTVVAWAGGTGSLSAGSLSAFALCGIVAFVVNWIVFVPSYLAQTEHYYDLTGSLTYLTLTFFSLAITGRFTEPAALLVAGCVTIWAVRLGSFLFRRVRADGSDGRFDTIKPDFLRFLMAWTLQGAWVFVTYACGLAIITSATPAPIGFWALLGAGLWAAGFGIEVTADRQKSAFRADPTNDGRFITSGLWAWSRHPNYFGEILLWIGIAVMSVPVLQGWQWATWVSPLWVMFLLTRVSGIPLLEARGKKRWGQDPDYRAYLERTPVLIPRPPRAA